MGFSAIGEKEYIVFRGQGWGKWMKEKGMPKAAEM